VKQERRLHVSVLKSLFAVVLRCFFVVSCLLLGFFILLLQFDLSGDKSREGVRRRWHSNLSAECYWTLFFKLEKNRPDLCQECSTIAVINEISSSVHNIVIVTVL
jgi:hypothetical protein